MQFVEGRPLDSIIAQAAPLPIAIVRTILTGVAEALAQAHRQGVVHRDVKPANIMIDRDGRPVVTDFGVAKVSQKPALTVTGAAVGTPHYMSPEQGRAEPITGASDQYSLGVVGFEMLTGKQLYPGESSVIIMFKHSYEEVPTRAAFGPDTPPDLADTLIRMLQKDPAQRWHRLEDAIPALRGGGDMHAPDTRSAMMALAAQGPQSEILARVNTPRSPTPLTARRAAVPGPEPAAPVPDVAAPVSGGARWWPVAVGGALAAAAALMLWRPWAPDAESPPAPSAIVTDSIATPPPPPAAPTVAEPPVPAATARETPAPPPIEAATIRELRFINPPATVEEGDTVSLRVDVLDQRGNPMRSAVVWSTSDPRTAVVRPDGSLVAQSAGRVVVSATSGGRQARAEIEIVSAVASVTVTPATETLAPAASTTLRASAKRRDGAEISGVAITWRSSDETVAVVSSTGRVTALSAGSATITATAAGRRGSAQITVAAAVAAAPPPAPQPAQPPQPPPEDAQAAIRDLVSSYARALESKDMTRVHALYPGMSANTERQTRSALAEMNDLRVNISAGGITVEGTRAQARVTGAWTYRGGRPLNINNLYRFERRAGGWVIVAIE
jgi:serine/threonine-protein kinase